MSFEGKTYWLIGASEGLGEALALALDREGARLILSARSKEKLEVLGRQCADARAVPIDVCDEKSVAEATKNAGAVDGIVYLAGAYDPMPAQDLDAGKAIKMLDVNLNGAYRVVAGVLPKFLQENAGHIVLIGSLAAFRGLPGAMGYSASKAGLLSFAESLLIDLKATDIKVQIINPGFIKSRLTDKNEFNMPQIMTAEKAADHVMRAMASRRFNVAFPKPFAWVFQVMRFLPMGIVKRLF